MAVSDQPQDADQQQRQADEEGLLPARRGVRLERMAAEQGQVPGVRAEHEVEQVAEDRDQADRQVDEQVDDHPGEDDARDAEPCRLGDDPRADDRRRSTSPTTGMRPMIGSSPTLTGVPGIRDELIEHVGDPPDPPLGRVEALAAAGPMTSPLIELCHRPSVRRGRVHAAIRHGRMSMSTS